MMFRKFHTQGRYLAGEYPEEGTWDEVWSMILETDGTVYLRVPEGDVYIKPWGVTIKSHCHYVTDTKIERGQLRVYISFEIPKPPAKLFNNYLTVGW